MKKGKQILSELWEEVVFFLYKMNSFRTLGWSGEQTGFILHKI